MLPKFVVSDLSLVPTAKLDDGDVHLILQKLDKVEMANIELRKSVNNFRTTFPRVAVGASRRTSGSGPSQHGITTPEPNKSETETHRRTSIISLMIGRSLSPEARNVPDMHSNSPINHLNSPRQASTVDKVSQRPTVTATR